MATDYQLTRNSLIPLYFYFKDLSYVSKSQSHTSFRLGSFEILLLENLQTEATLLQSFLDHLIHHSHNTTANSLLTSILDECLDQPISGASLWLKSINTRHNLTDKCLLNADKSTLIATLNDTLQISRESHIVACLLNKAAYSASIPPQEDDPEQHAASVSVYQFCRVYNSLLSNKEIIAELDSILVGLRRRSSDWLERMSSKDGWLRERVFVELVVSQLIEMCLAKEAHSKELTGKCPPGV